MSAVLAPSARAGDLTAKALAAAPALPARSACPMPDGAVVTRLAGWAVAFDTKLCTLADDLDPSWREPLLASWAFLEAMPAERAQALWPRLWRDRLAQAGHWPALSAFEQPLARLCLLPRGEVLQRLCALALACRPGVLRCCIDRSVRGPLQRALGDWFAVLAAFSPQGRPVDALQAGWSPVQWACVGFMDWQAALPAQGRLTSSLVRWSLPRSLLDPLIEAGPVPVQRPVDAAVAALAEAGWTWPC